MNMMNCDWSALLGFMLVLNPVICCKNEYTGDHQYFSTNCNLTQVPTDIPPIAREVWLNNNRITEIRLQSFTHLCECNAIFLYNNKLVYLRPGMFDGLYFVKLLWLYNNEISHIEAQSFLNLSECTWLDLSRNKLTEIKLGTFNGLDSLKGLILDRNRISYIEPGSFSHLPLEGLTLSYNRLTALHQHVLPKSQSTVISLVNNPIFCDNSTYWIKEAEKEGRITWKYNDHKPNCANCPGVMNWDDVPLNCSVTGNLYEVVKKKKLSFVISSGHVADNHNSFSGVVQKLNSDEQPYELPLIDETTQVPITDQKPFQPTTSQDKTTEPHISNKLFQPLSLNTQTTEPHISSETSQPYTLDGQTTEPYISSKKSQPYTLDGQTAEPHISSENSQPYNLDGQTTEPHISSKNSQPYTFEGQTPKRHNPHETSYLHTLDGKSVQYSTRDNVIGFYFILGIVAVILLVIICTILILYKRKVLVPRCFVENVLSCQSFRQEVPGQSYPLATSMSRRGREELTCENVDDDEKEATL